MSEWIPSYASLRDHPKLKRLSRILAMERPAVVGYLHYLWWWAMDYAPDGDLSRFTADDVADAIDWQGDASEFMGALRSSGFVDGDQLHDWSEYGGKLQEKRENNAERMRNARANRVQRTCETRAEDVQRTCRAREERGERGSARVRARKSSSEGSATEPDSFLESEAEREMFLAYKAAQQERDRKAGITDGR